MAIFGSALEPEQVIPNAAAPTGGMFGGGAMNRFVDNLQNPFAATLLSAGGAMLGAAQDGGFGHALQAGLGGGLAGAIGASQLRKQKMDEEERNRMMRELIERYAQIGVQTPGIAGGLFSSTSYGR